MRVSQITPAAEWGRNNYKWRHHLAALALRAPRATSLCTNPVTLVEIGEWRCPRVLHAGLRDCHGCSNLCHILLCKQWQVAWNEPFSFIQAWQLHLSVRLSLYFLSLVFSAYVSSVSFYELSLSISSFPVSAFLLYSLLIFCIRLSKSYSSFGII